MPETYEDLKGRHRLINCKQCGYPVPSNKKTCGKCGAIRPIDPRIKKLGIAAALTLPLFMCSLCILMAYLLPDDYRSQTRSIKKPSVSQPTEYKEDKYMAYAAMQHIVEQKLTSPSTASFPWGMSDHVKYIGDNQYMISSWVDSQNGFGATVRTNFSGVVEQTGEESWDVRELYLHN